MKIFTNVVATSSVILSGTKWSRRIFIGVLFAVLCFFTACDSGSSSADPDSIAEVSSSSDDDAISSSSITDKGTSSGGGSRSSSSVKPGDDSQKSSSDNISSSSDNVSSSSREACAVEGLYHEVWSAEDQAWIGYYCQNGFYVLESEYVFPSSSSFYDMSKQYNENVEYGEFTDPRDGKVYRTITYAAKPYISSNIVAMASNLNYGEMVPVDSATNADGDIEKFCYNDDPWYCENGFGGLYSWSEVMNFHRACDTLFLGASADCPNVFDDENSERRQHQGICPEGWHVMNEFEWRRLPSTNFGASQMLSKLFRGTDKVGFSALLGGGYLRGKYKSMGMYGEYWVPAERGDDALYAQTTLLDKSEVAFRDSEQKPSKLPIRCVMNYSVD